MTDDSILHNGGRTREGDDDDDAKALERREFDQPFNSSPTIGCYHEKDNLCAIVTETDLTIGNDTKKKEQYMGVIEGCRLLSSRSLLTRASRRQPQQVAEDVSKP